MLYDLFINYLTMTPFVFIALVLAAADLTFFGMLLIALLWPLVVLSVVYDIVLLLMDLVVRLYNKRNKQKLK